LFEEYAAALSIDLCFQNFAQELAALPKMYGPPGGALLLAEIDAASAGCVAVRQLDAATCELKRLYVRPTHCGHNLGRQLAQAALETARALGYQRIRLDTLPEMQPAQRLYESLGFHDIPAYYGDPIAGQRFMGASLN
jgi:ribosomal protein S18 acetylase RimI-like enzyme